ncbi:MAG: hypothetical protein IKW81_07600 [Pseudobutyrivibrio sp.]|nr:hypothetical protein [Pseudobutyrivibrio sp.]
MKKRILALMCTTAVLASAFVACGSEEEDVTTFAPSTTTEEAATETAPATTTTNTVAAGELLTGLGTSVSIADSKDPADGEDGTAQVDATIAAVTVDSEGKVVECKIDIAQTKIGVSANGKITSDLNAEYPSKRELGDSYGMKKASVIGKEWYEQADAFAAWTVGKTASEISGMSIDQGLAGDADLAASVSIHVTGFQSAVLEAINKAVAGGAAAGDKLGLGLSTNIAKSTDASADAEGVAEAYTTISVLTVNADGVITSSILDAVQAKVTFDASGVITADKSVDVPSKNELGDAYGMKSASAIGKEWNEQAQSYADWTVGHSLSDINGLQLDEGRVADEDLAASVSIHVTDFNSVISKAIASAE